MYLEFFGLSEKPFTITPNPRFLFLSKNHKEVFAHLLYGIRNHSGFIEVTGEVGAGKTTVLRTLFEQLEGDEYRLAFIFNPSLSAQELLRAICRELQIATAASSNGEILDALNDYLLRENQAGRTVVLVIDEAQNLSPAVLEQIRLLSNLETEGDKLIQIVLVGQPELGDLLDRPDLRQLNQRISVRYHLHPIDFDDTRAYVRHRLELAGVRDRELFSAAALRRIFRYSGGLPRLINVLCDRALLVAYSEDARQVDRGEVRTAIAELRRQSRPRGRRLLATAAGLTATMLVAAFIFWGAMPRPSSGPSPGNGSAAHTRNVSEAAGGPSELPVPPQILEHVPEVPDPGILVGRPPKPAPPGKRDKAVSTVAPDLQGPSSAAGIDSSAPEFSVEPVSVGPLTLGYVSVAGAPLGSSAQVAPLADFLGNQLGTPVRIEPFATKLELYQALYRYRKIDLAIFQGALPERPNHLPLNRLALWQGLAADQNDSGLVAARRGLSSGTLTQLRQSLQGMNLSNEGQAALLKSGRLKLLPSGTPGKTDAAISRLPAKDKP